MSSNEHESIPTVKDIPFSSNVITLSSEMSIIKAFEILVEHNILSAPVWSSEQNKYVGFFDVGDFAAYVVELLEEQQKHPSCPTEFCDLRDLLDTMSDLQPKLLSSVVNASKHDNFIPVKPDAPLTDVLQILGQNGVHRVPVVDDRSGRILKIISQSSITRFIFEHAHLIKDLQREPIKGSVAMTKSVISVSVNDPVETAFLRMRDCKLSGLAVLDESGKLLTTISNSDLRTVVSKKKFRFYGLSVLEFVQQSRALDGPNVKPSVVTVTEDKSLYDATSKLAATKLHRVFVTDLDHNLIGVISLKDILRFILLNTTD